MVILNQARTRLPAFLYCGSIILLFFILSVIWRHDALIAGIFLLAGAVTGFVVYFMNLKTVPAGKYAFLFRKNEPEKGIPLAGGHYWIFPFFEKIAPAELCYSSANFTFDRVQTADLSPMSLNAALRYESLVSTPIRPGTAEEELKVLVAASLETAIMELKLSHDSLKGSLPQLEERLRDQVFSGKGTKLISKVDKVTITMNDHEPHQGAGFSLEVLPPRLQTVPITAPVSDVYKDPASGKALIYREELDYIARWVVDYPNIETGGDLFGFWTYSGYPVIQYAIGPGPAANHQPAFFNQDADYLEDMGKVLRTAHGLQHIGEWHSHHRMGLAEPSGHDSNTINKAVTRYGLGQFFLVIANIRENAATINGFLYKKERGGRHDRISWVVLEGRNPIRQAFDAEFNEKVYRPVTQTALITGLAVTGLGEAAMIKPVYSSGYWLNEKSCHQELKKLLDSMNRDMGKTEVFQEEKDKTVFLDFKYHGQHFALYFPQEFPRSKPLVSRITQNGEVPLDTSTTAWESGNEIAGPVLTFVKNALKSY